MTETTAGCIYQTVGISPSGSTGVLIANMECRLIDEAGNGKKFDPKKSLLIHFIL